MKRYFPGRAPRGYKSSSDSDSEDSEEHTQKQIDVELHVRRRGDTSESLRPPRGDEDDGGHLLAQHTAPATATQDPRLRRLQRRAWQEEDNGQKTGRRGDSENDGYRHRHRRRGSDADRDNEAGRRRRDEDIPRGRDHGRHPDRGDFQARDDGSDDEDREAELRRERIRQRALERERAEMAAETASLAQPGEPKSAALEMASLRNKLVEEGRKPTESRGKGSSSMSSTEDDESSSEEETSSGSGSESSEDVVRRPLFKPVFVPKVQRETVQEREAEEQRAIEAEKRLQEELEKRKLESVKLVEEEVRRDIIRQQESGKNDDNEPLDVDDTDGVNEEEEFEAWKLRELMRLRRERDAARARETEAAEIARRRAMSDAEIMAELAADPNQKKDRGQRTFLQKYYHKGAFYQDLDIVKKRDFSAPTLEDKVDKSVLPEVMQVKNFGKMGRTKWTHLTNEDTSRRDAAWAQKNNLNQRMLSRLGGYKGGFDKPGRRKRE